MKLSNKFKNVLREHYPIIKIKKTMMPNDYSNNSFIINDEKKRFELSIDTHIVFIEFILNKENILFLTHTEVPQQLEGKGVGSAIVEKALNYSKENNYTVAPLCPFVAKYIKKNPEWENIIAKGYHL